MSNDIKERLRECIEKHDRTGYSGVLKWQELKDALAHIEQLEAELKGVYKLEQKRIMRIAGLEAERDRYRRMWLGQTPSGGGGGVGITEGRRK